MSTHTNTAHTQPDAPQTIGALADALERRLETVNLTELRRVETRLVKLEQQEKSRLRKQDVFFVNNKGRLDSRTIGAFLDKGLPYLEKGLSSILKDQEHRSRLARLHRLEALYQIFTSSAAKWNEVSGQDVINMCAQIQGNVARYQPSAY